LSGSDGPRRVPQLGQQAEARQRRSSNMRRTVGNDGRGGGPGGPAPLFPPRPEPQVLEGEGDHRHQGVSVQARPRSSLEVVEAQLLLDSPLTKPRFSRVALVQG
jgi:hypothetical protein